MNTLKAKIYFFIVAILVGIPVVGGLMEYVSGPSGYAAPSDPNVRVFNADGQQIRGPITPRTPVVPFYGPGVHRVVYRIATSECTEFSVTYEMPGGTSQRSVTACPGDNSVDIFDGSSGDFVYLSIQNSGNSSIRARFACVILDNEVEVARVWSSGRYSIASCSGSWTSSTSCEHPPR